MYADPPFVYMHQSPAFEMSFFAIVAYSTATKSIALSHAPRIVDCSIVICCD